MLLQAKSLLAQRYEDQENNKDIGCLVTDVNTFSYTSASGPITFSTPVHNPELLYDETTGIYTCPIKTRLNIYTKIQPSFTGGYWSLCIYSSLDGGTTWGAKRWGEQITPNLANEFLVGDWINEGVEAGEMLRPWIIYMGGTAGTITRITSGALRHELRIQKALSQF